MHLRLRPQVVIIALVALLAGALPLRGQASAPTVVLLVRHAEKGATPPNDPPLTDPGERRARALVSVAKDAGVSAIVTTQFVRTRATAAPLAAMLGVEPLVVAAGGTVDAHARATADTILRRYAGRTVLVVGHSNTIPAIVAAFGGPRVAELCDADYDSLFVLVITGDAPARLVRARFGAPSELTTGCSAMTP